MLLASLTAPSLTRRCAHRPSCRGALLRSLWSLNLLAAAARGELLDLLAPAAAADLPSRRRQAVSPTPRPNLSCLLPLPGQCGTLHATCRVGHFRCDATPEQVMAAGAPSLFGRTLNTAAAARPVRQLLQRGSSAAASLGARQAPQPWATGAWGAAAGRRAPTCPAPTASMSSSSGGGSASAMAAAASPSAALAPSTIIDAEPQASSAASTATGASSGSAAGLATLEDLQFDNTFTRELPAGERLLKPLEMLTLAMRSRGCVVLRKWRGVHECGLSWLFSGKCWACRGRVQANAAAPLSLGAGSCCAVC